MWQNTLALSSKPAVPVHSIADITDLGVYLTVAVKEVRPGVSMPRELIEKYAPVLEEEIAQFPNLKVLLLMGVVAIKALNLIARRKTGKPCIPLALPIKFAIREYSSKYARFPSYLQTVKIS
jgi:hypothetical protein